MRLFFRQYGQGFPVIVLHGLFGLSDNWVTFGRRLADDFSVYLLDLRNHGQSPHSDEFTFEAMEADLLEFLDERGFPEVHLIGHSLGGKVAMLFSLDHPERLKKLVIADISLRNYTDPREQLDLIRAMQAVDLSRAGSRSDVDRQLSLSVKNVRIRQFLLKNVFWKSPSVLAWRLNLAGISENIFRVFQAVEREGIFPGPALLVRGGRSDYVTEEDLLPLKIKFPRLAVQTLENASHWVHADEPEKFYELVRDFLK
ncbi:MAG TPA: alpha/beta fold hydrolase [Bacteroidales bacterium]|nr:alpha/beta fold hydrolase [Bacteroidales bacterium]